MTEPTYLGHGRWGQALFLVLPALIGVSLGLGLWASLGRFLGKDW
jgi:hypothetical protein